MPTKILKYWAEAPPTVGGAVFAPVPLAAPLRLLARRCGGRVVGAGSCRASVAVAPEVAPLARFLGEAMAQ